jgi:hypothetical protein
MSVRNVIFRSHPKKLKKMPVSFDSIFSDIFPTDKNLTSDKYLTFKVELATTVQ